MAQTTRIARLNITDAADLAACVNTAFAHEHTDVDRTQTERLLALQAHHVAGAFGTDGLNGFCDSFETRSGSTSRWEIDLLGVVPSARGRRLARMLVHDSVTEAKHRGSSVARALVRHDNHAAQAVFSALHFSKSDLRALWVAEPHSPRTHAADVKAICISVTTLTYAGIWIEDPQNAAALELARGLSQDSTHVIGAVLPAESDAGRWAERAGYQRVDLYHWWTLSI